MSKNNPDGYNRHHRKPTRWGGRDNKENISLVLIIEHKAWNELFDNLEAYDVVRLFGQYWEMFGDESKVKYEIRQIAISVLNQVENFQEYKEFLSDAELARIKNLLSTQRSRIKKSRAWRLLFHGLSLEQIVAKINDVWIDPDYRLVVEVTQATRVKLEARFS